MPLLGGAMEHPGLITFNSEQLLSKESEDSPRRQRGFASTQVHELRRRLEDRDDRHDEPDRGDLPERDGRRAGSHGTC